MNPGSPTLEREEAAEACEPAAAAVAEPVLTTPKLARASGAPTPRLNPSEIHMLEWLAAGRTNAQIAQCVGRSVKTIGNQLTRVYAKLGVVNRAEAVAMYLREWQT